MRAWTVAAFAVLAGCGGGSAARDGAAGSTGAGGVATGGAGAATGGAAGGNSGGLPACAIATRPNDPTKRAANLIDSSTAICSTIALDGAWVADECFEMVDGGWQQDGGPALVVPEGGALLDGDYELVRYQVNFSGQPCAPGATTGSVNRRIRVFDGGRYVEWAATNRDANGTDTNYWYDTTVSAAGHTLSTASGDDFTYFRFSNEDGTGGLTNVVTYRRHLPPLSRFARSSPRATRARRASYRALKLSPRASILHAPHGHRRRSAAKTPIRSNQTP